jgi:serine/threonine protein kinase
MGTSQQLTGQQGQPRKPRHHNDVKTLGRYVVDKKLGEGGMGTVYRATDTQLGRIVAIKVLPLEKAKEPRLVKRFRAEAQAAAQLKHKNIVGVYDSGEIDGLLYIAMEYVDGIDVHELVKRKGVLDVRRSRDIIRQLARALQHAHEQNIVHRDIKPANLMIDREGKVRLADMGLARSLDDSEKAGITRAGTTVGTIDYMSPEQTRDSRSADTRSDMYSLGATWYHMLTGQTLFPEGDLLNRINAHATVPPPNPQDLNDEIPDGVVEVMHRMLEKDPADRYQTPADLLEALERMSMKKQTEIDAGLLAGLMEDDDVSARTSSPKRKKKRSAAKKRPAGKSPSQKQQPVEDPPEEESDDDLYGLRPPTPGLSAPGNDADDESDMDLPPGGDGGEGGGGGDLNLGLLAALAEEDDEPPPSPPPTASSAAPPRKAAPRQRSGSVSDARRTARKDRGPDERREQPAPAPARPKNKRTKKRPRPEQPRDDTAADNDTTDTSMPSRREVMLGRSSRHGRTGSAGSAMDDRKEMLKIGGIVVVVCVIGWFVFSAMTGGSQTPESQPGQGEVSPGGDSPDSGTATGGAGSQSAPRSGS